MRMSGTESSPGGVPHSLLSGSRSSRESSVPGAIDADPGECEAGVGVSVELRGREFSVPPLNGLYNHALPLRMLQGFVVLSHPRIW